MFVYRLIFIKCYFPGSDLQITHVSSRIAFLQTMLFSLLIYNYYSASVVSARLSEPLEKINDSLNELAKTSLKFGAEPSLYFNFFIKVIFYNMIF